MRSMNIGVCILILYQICSTRSNNNTSSEIRQQHFDLQQNQIMMMNSLRKLVSLKKEGMVKASLEFLKKQFSDLEKDMKWKMKRMEQEIQSTISPKESGAVFTRWGREGCPNSSFIIYSGSLGGSHYNYYGGGSSYLCMHHEPEFTKQLSGTHASLFGGEYNGGASNFGKTGLVNGDDIPCAVCQSTRGSQKLMIPGRVTCSKGWTKQYSGYLATALSGSHKSSAEFICMDRSPTASHGGHHNYNGALPYPVKAVCGSLPCPKYRNGRTITCVVCTK